MYIFKTTFILVTLFQNVWTVNKQFYDAMLVQVLQATCATKILNLMPLSGTSLFLADKKALEMSIQGHYPKVDEPPASDGMSTLYCTMYLFGAREPVISQIMVDNDTFTVPEKYKLADFSLTKGGTVDSISRNSPTKVGAVVQEIIGEKDISTRIRNFKIVEAGICFDKGTGKEGNESLGLTEEILVVLRLQQQGGML